MANFPDRRRYTCSRCRQSIPDGMALGVSFKCGSCRQVSGGAYCPACAPLAKETIRKGKSRWFSSAGGTCGCCEAAARARAAEEASRDRRCVACGGTYRFGPSGVRPSDAGNYEDECCLICHRPVCSSDNCVFKWWTGSDVMHKVCLDCMARHDLPRRPLTSREIARRTWPWFLRWLLYIVPD